MPSLVSEACTVLGIEAGPKGVPDEATVASAFKKLAIRWHPDRNPDHIKEATQRFAEISAARDLLLDPPTNALLDEPPAASSQRSAAGGAADPYPKSAHSKNLRAFEGDVTEAVDSRAFGGKEAAELFESFGLWAVWKCNGCNAVCCRIRKNKYSCMCGHRLRDHDAANGFRCSDLKCICKRYEFQVQDTDQPHKCRCKHAPKDHEPFPPYACTKCTDCAAFDSPWVCNCGHLPSEHSTCFVQHKYAERAREWVCGGLRGECVAMARKFRQRSVAERVSFIQRANAAKAAGFPSWKAMQREAALHAKHGTAPVQGGPHMNGKAPDTSHASSSGASTAEAGSSSAADATRCGDCEPEQPGLASAGFFNAGGGFDRTAAARAGFAASQETTHGMTTEELRAKLAQAGVGVRMATAADFTGGPGLW